MSADLQLSTEMERLFEEIKELNEKGYEDMKELIPKGLNIVNNYIIKIRVMIKRIVLAYNSDLISELFLKMYAKQLERLQMILSLYHNDTIEYIEISKIISKVN